MTNDVEHLFFACLLAICKERTMDWQNESAVCDSVLCATVLHKGNAI